MKDLMGMMGKLQEMQTKMTDMQEQIAQTEVSGSAGGGMVTVTLSGKGELHGVKIDPALLKPEDSEMLEDLLIAAHSDAKAKAETLMNDKMQEITAGLPIPPGMKLPF